ncbi:SusC/RagA family TonB-linked outer membrane protein [Saccharicrinis sp. FJH62]|uniref:SusC/RagA family TonB-linked outer membrane protein n=1 Tax=Saccharicrinis sp. FJH62 TaxID=3344657 RepID=UPI0035D48796
MKSKLEILVLALFLLLPFFSFGQSTGDVIIQGTVTSKADGETLIAVAVTEVDENNRIVNSAITDFNGHYVIKVKDTSNKLNFRFIGFKDQSFEIGSNREINVEMVEDVKVLGEFTAEAERTHSEGNFKIPEREISTAVQTIDTKKFEGVQVTTIDDALQGRIAGLDIVANSGDPGAGSSMRIRGTSSINANTEPLIVLNGIPYEVNIDPNFDFANANTEQYANMLSINPDDIQEITVLKDAASTAVWGSKGANGVLLITTKKGVSGPTRIQYTLRTTAARQPKGIKMLTGDDYTMLMKQAYFNPYQNEAASDVDEFNYDPTFSEYQNFNNNTDWIDEVIQTGFTQDHYLTVSGGGDRALYRVSGGFYKQRGTIIGQVLNRVSSRAYLDYMVSDRLRFISEFSFTYSDNQRNYSNLLGIAYRKMPNVSVYKQDIFGRNTDEFYNIRRDSRLNGAQRDLYNPVALAYLATNNLKTYRILPTFRLNYDILDPDVQYLRYSVYVSFDINNNKTTSFLPAEATNAYWDNSNVNRSVSGDSESMTVQTDNNITWQPKFSNPAHTLTLYGSFQLRTGNSQSQGNSIYGVPFYSDASVDAYLDGINTSRFAWRSMGMLARMHYAYKGRYIMGASIRRDGSTKFGNDRKFGNFPGISFKWIISDEPFMKSTQNWLSMLAIRPSWGVTGNPPDEEYLHFSRYGNYGSYAGIPATRPTSLQLSDLRWERTSSFNYGADLGFFNDKYIMDFNFYQKRTDDQLFKNLSIPSTSGASSYSYQNVGTMDNNGWELNFNANRIIKKGDFSADFNFNLANNVNKIVHLIPAVLNTFNGEYDYTNGSYLTRIQEGNSFGSIYGFKYKGVYQYSEYVPGTQENAPVARDELKNVIVDENGDPLPMVFAYGKSSEYEFQGGDAIYEDINHDGSIDELDIVYLGNSNPKVNGGFGSLIRYKNLSCNMFFNFRYGNKIVNAARMNAENMYGNDNQSIAVNWRWRKDGDITNMPRALYQYGFNWLGSDRYVEDGSFLRFKYLTFNYAVPSKALKKYNLKQLNFYLTFNNVLVFTKYSGVDPEVGYGGFNVSTDNSRTPRSKDVTLGITISL